MKTLFVLLLLLFIAAVWDFHQGRIPNILIISGIIIGIIRMSFSKEIGEILLQTFGMILPVIILYPFFKIGTIGAGDIKLFSMLGCYLTFQDVLICMFLTFVLGAMVSVIKMISNKTFINRISYFFCFLKDCLRKGKIQYYYIDSNGNRVSEKIEKDSKIHMAMYLFLGVLFHMGGVI